MFNAMGLKTTNMKKRRKGGKKRKNEGRKGRKGEKDHLSLESERLLLYLFKC